MDAKTIVLKFGGSAFQPEALKPFAERVHAYASGGHRVIIVHGGGKEIDQTLDAIGHKSTRVDGLRVTDDTTLKVVEMVLCGRVNKAIVRALLQVGVAAVGLSGQDGALLVARQHFLEKTDANGQVMSVDLGHVGVVERVNPEPVNVLLRNHMVPVVAPLGVSSQGAPLNLNADTAAAALAGAVKADLFALLTDVPGVLVPKDGVPELAPVLTAPDVERLKTEGVITGGMIPKVDCCLAALRGGAKSSLIASMKNFTDATELQGTRIVEESP